MTESSTSEHVHTSIDGGVLRIQIDRPDKKNALGVDMYAAMADAMAAAEEDPAVRVMVITGTGDSFTSGNDVMDFMNAPPTDESSPVVRFIRAIATAEKPLVAAVNGSAVGIGVTMLLHCDLVYAAEEARFRMPFVNLGLAPEAGSSLLLPLTAGYQRAAELILLGEYFSAEKAQEAGFVNEVMPASELDAKVAEAVEKLLKQPLGPLKAAKRLMRAPVAAQLEEVIMTEGEVFFALLRQPAFAEAVQAMFMKREPDFSECG